MFSGVDTNAIADSIPDRSSTFVLQRHLFFLKYLSTTEDFNFLTVILFLDNKAYTCLFYKQCFFFKILDIEIFAEK